MGRQNAAKANFSENKVFVVNDSGHDFSNARTFGELQMLTEGSPDIFSVDRQKVMLERKLVEFQEEDFLLLTGRTIINVLAFSILQEKGFNPIKVLLYNAKTREYIPRDIFVNSYNAKIL